ncbi:MAG TPA: septum formation initiator family protein [Chthoniobacteraceae bacterium]|nr:septum formation initiator family protein [Chthoniobacteraceae bacterium]
MKAKAASFRKRDPGVWPVLNRLVVATIILALCVGAVVAFLPILNQRKAQARRLNELRTEVARQEALIAKNSRAVELLKSDPEYIETIARDRLDLMKPGETIFRIEADGEVLQVNPAAETSATPAAEPEAKADGASGAEATPDAEAAP